MGASSSVAGTSTANPRKGSIDSAASNFFYDDEKITKTSASNKSKKMAKQVEKKEVGISADDKKLAAEIRKTHPKHENTFKLFDNTLQVLKNYDSNIDDVLNKLINLNNLILNSTQTNIDKIYADYFALIGFVDIGVERYRAILKADNLEFVDEKYVTKYNDGEVVTQTDLCQGHLLLQIQLIFYNFSDNSTLFSERIAKSGFFQFLFKSMDDLRLTMKENKTCYGSLLDSVFSILHNCGKDCSSDTRECFRKEDAVKRILPFLETNQIQVKVLVLMILSNIVNEEENGLLLADDSVFETIIKMTKLAKKKVSHRYEGFSVEELTAGIKGLAKNDDNKVILMKKGVMSLLKEIITEKHDEGEVLEATEAIRVLSFAKEIKKNIKNDKELMKLLNELTTSKTNNKIVQAASGVLWNLKEDKEKSFTGLDHSSGHVMISYQWGDQKKLIQIQQALTDNGYSVWIDVNDMEGSTLQAMADAVEKAVVVILCMSERYKESSNCRTEAEYAFTLKKPIIPLMMQRGYKPDGWLGMILGAKLFVDFSGKYAFDDSLNKLYKQLGEDGRLKQIITVPDSVDGPVASVKAVPLKAAKSSSPVISWSQQDVQKWLTNNKLDRHKSLQSLNGEQLVFLKKLCNRAPEFFYSYLNSRLGLNQLNDMTKFCNAIDQL